MAPNPKAFVASAFVLSLALALTACNGDDASSRDPAPTAPTTAKSVPAVKGAPREVAAHPDDWVLPGRDYDNSRATTHSSITRDNVTRLDVAWEANVTGPLTTVPLIVGATIYV